MEKHAANTPPLDDEDSAHSSLQDVESAESAEDPVLEPLTLSLVGRFFGVPLLIIALIVAGAVLVVFLFGGPATERTRSVDSLMQTLEASSGEKSMGILLPREKELWQAALELGQRLAKKNTELSEEEIESVAERLAALVQRDLKALDAVAFAGADIATQRQVRSNRLRFIIHALGRTESQRAVEPLLMIVRENREPFVAAAIQEFGETPRFIGDPIVIDAIVEVVRASDRAETLLVACPVLSIIASPANEEVIAALSEVRLRHEGEVNWAASLALARMGSDRGKSTLLDLMDRNFLQTSNLYTAVDPEGTVVGRYQLPPERVDATIMAAMEAASKLDDADLWNMIRELKSDPSLAVRGKAEKIVSERT